MMMMMMIMQYMDVAVAKARSRMLNGLRKDVSPTAEYFGP